MRHFCSENSKVHLEDIPVNLQNSLRVIFSPLILLFALKGHETHGLKICWIFTCCLTSPFRARITTTIVYSKNIHFSQCDGTTTIFHLCLILTTILCRSNIPLCVVQTSMFDANDVITSTSFFKAFYAQKQFKNQVRL